MGSGPGSAAPEVPVLLVWDSHRAENSGLFGGSWRETPLTVEVRPLWHAGHGLAKSVKYQFECGTDGSVHCVTRSVRRICEHRQKVSTRQYLTPPLHWEGYQACCCGFADLGGGGHTQPLDLAVKSKKVTSGVSARGSAKEAAELPSAELSDDEANDEEDEQEDEDEEMFEVRGCVLNEASSERRRRTCGPVVRGSTVQDSPGRRSTARTDATRCGGQRPQHLFVRFLTERHSAVAVQQSTALHRTPEQNRAEHSAVQWYCTQHGTVQNITVHYTGVQCGAVQYTALHCTAVQYSTVQCSVVPPPPRNQDWLVPQSTIVTSTKLPPPDLPRGDHIRPPLRKHSHQNGVNQTRDAHPQRAQHRPLPTADRTQGPLPTAGMPAEGIGRAGTLRIKAPEQIELEVGACARASEGRGARIRNPRRRVWKTLEEGVAERGAMTVSSPTRAQIRS